MLSIYHFDDSGPDRNIFIVLTGGKRVNLMKGKTHRTFQHAQLIDDTSQPPYFTVKVINSIV